MTNIKKNLLKKNPKLGWYVPMATVTIGLIIHYLLHPSVGIFTFILTCVILCIVNHNLLRGMRSQVRYVEQELLVAMLRQEALASLEQFDDVLDSMNDSFFSIDRNWRFTRMNKQYEKAEKVQRKNLLGTDLRKILTEQNLHNSKFWNEYHKVMTERIPVVFQKYYSRMEIWIECRAYPTRDGGMAVTFLDITDRIQIQEKLQRSVENLKEAKSEAERANALKSAFLANMSHEIRTPLGAMIGFADLLRDRALTSEERLNYIDIITRNGEQLSMIINDILDLSKVEAGHLTLEFSDASPKDIVSDVISLLKVKADEKNVNLEFLAEPTSPMSIVTDSLRLKQILMNIVSNAIKFTQSGAVIVRSFGNTNNNGRINLYLEVTDTGIGVPDDQRDKIFDAFVQADGALSRKYGGTGLGLALSRQLARQLGGDIQLTKSIEGKGSSFLITIADQPQFIENGNSSTRPNPEVATEILPGALSGIQILAVDDSPDNRQLLSLFLTKYGAHVDFAENGLVACKKALGGNFDIVLMDIQMPEMDGYTATQNLREAGFQKPIVALTAHAMDEVRKKCLNVGCTDHLSKPIRPKELLDTVVRYTRSRKMIL